jgi:hypothetical protein
MDVGKLHGHSGTIVKAVPVRLGLKASDAANLRSDWLWLAVAATHRSVHGMTL